MTWNMPLVATIVIHNWIETLQPGFQKFHAPANYVIQMQLYWIGLVFVIFMMVPSDDQMICKCLIGACDIWSGIKICFLIGFLSYFLTILVLRLSLSFTALKQTVAESVGDWFFNRNIVKEIDCPYPCDPTCHHVDFTEGWWSFVPLQFFLMGYSQLQTSNFSKHPVGNPKHDPVFKQIIAHGNPL